MWHGKGCISQGQPEKQHQYEMNCTGWLSKSEVKEEQAVRKGKLEISGKAKPSVHSGDVFRNFGSAWKTSQETESGPSRLPKI